MALSYALKKLSEGRYDNRGYSNEQSLANLMITAPSELNQMMTYTFGLDDDRFPLGFMTEGQGEAGLVKVKTLQWTWKTMGRLKFNDSVLAAPAADGNVGANGTTFDVEFKTHFIIEQHGLMSNYKGKLYRVRVMRDLGAGPNGGFLYRLRNTDPNPNATIPAAAFGVGRFWTLTAPTVSESYSKGNRANVMGPGKMTSQHEFHRYSKEIGGSTIVDAVTTYEFKTKSGGTTTRWINEEMRQFELMRRIEEEERLWYAQYNRDANGNITLRDPDNNEPIPHCAGMEEICDEANYATYGDKLTLNLIKRTVGDVLSTDTGNESKEIVLCGGKGFIEDWQQAISDEAFGNNFVTALGEKMIETSGDGLSYGKYFNKYKMPDGTIITVKNLPFLDKGTLAENDKANGEIHPVTGYPMCSHQAYLMDFSSYEGQKNVRKVQREGQEYIVGIIQGMTKIPEAWGAGGDSIRKATDVAKSNYEVMYSTGLQVNNTTKFMHLKCVL